MLLPPPTSAPREVSLSSHLAFVARNGGNVSAYLINELVRIVM